MVEEEYKFISDKTVGCDLDFLCDEEYFIDMNNVGRVRNATEKEIKLCKEFKNN